MSPRRIRSAITMGVLAVLIVVGGAWGWASLTSPFPEGGLGGSPAAEEICTPREVAAGERVTVDGVTVSVVNAGERSGAARSTLDDLVEAGFAEGEQGNAPDDADVNRVQIWAPDPDDPAVRLVASWLGPNVRVEDSPAEWDGVYVVVGDQFPGVGQGRRGVRAAEDTTVCGPSTA